MKALLSFTSLALFIVIATLARSQSADIPPAVTRVPVVNKISQVAGSRGKAISIPEDYVNPFVGRVKQEVVPEVSSLPVPVGLSGPELLSQLSSKVPSTGTLVFGGNAMLLLGSKKVKVGEKLVVNHDGKDYELTLTAVTTTTFTVKLGDEFSTRPVRKR